MKKMNKNGFTIVELVIVIAVIAILAAVLIPTFSNVIKKADESATLQAAKSKFEEIYALDYADGTLHGSSDSAVAAASDTMSGVTTYTVSNGSVTKFVYEDSKATATYESDEWKTLHK